MIMNIDLDNICYKRNFLSEVIIRLDFLSPLLSIKTKLPIEIKSSAIRDFPIAEPIPMHSQEYMLSGKEFVEKQKTSFIEWQFRDKDRTKLLAFSPNFLYVKCTNYINFDSFSDDFLRFIDDFFNVFSDVQVSRIGLRYINNVSVDGINPLDWKGIINRNLISLFSFEPDIKHLSRLIQVLEYSYEKFNLRFQCGMHNPDYPAIIKRKLFVLDYDAYFKGLIEQSEIPGYISILHDKIQSLFELSIDENLREKMNE